MRILVILFVSLWSAIICQGAPQGAAEADELSRQGRQDDGADAQAAVDLTEATELMTFLRDMVKMPIEMIIQDRLFQPNALLEKTVQDTMTDVLKVRKVILDRIKEVRDGTIAINSELSLRQEETLNDLRMDVMDVLLLLVEPDANTLEALENVGKKLLEIRATIVDRVMMLIMIRDGTSPPSGAECECEPYRSLVDTTEAAPLKEMADGKKILEALSMQLMDVDALVKTSYTSILAASEPEKRKKEQDELLSLKEVSNCLNDVLVEISGEVAQGDSADLSKVNRVLDRKLEGCRSDIKRKLNECEEECPRSKCDSCGAMQIDEILDKLQTWLELLESDGGEGRTEDIREEALSLLKKLDEEMTKLITNKIQSEDPPPKCDVEKLTVIKKSKNPLWMLVNITIFAPDDGVVTEMLTALITATTDMRREFCKDDSTAPPDTESCDLEEIETAKEWTTTIDTVITEKIFGPDVNAQEVMIEIVTIKGLMEERVRELFKDGNACNDEVTQIKNIYSQQVTKCLDEMMELKPDEFASKERHERVSCMKQLRNMIEERRGMLWMTELMKKIEQEAEKQNEQGA